MVNGRSFNAFIVNLEQVLSFCENCNVFFDYYKKDFSNGWTLTEVYFNPFVPNASFPYRLKKSENRKVF